MTARTYIERDADVLVILIDNPPINAGSFDVRAGVLRGIFELVNDPDLRAAVIMGSGTTFIAGSDLREFGLPLTEPQLPAVIAAIEACAKPVVAALHGAALGGGFELALGCDARVALHGTIVGLPEVTLGMIPGAGGTQRLPRITGVARAIGMICSGERVGTEEAAALGLIDVVVSGGLRDAAVALARSMAGRKRRLRDETPPPNDDARIEAAASKAIRSGRNRPPVIAAIEAVKSSATLLIDEALARERKVFQEFRVGPEATALRYQFFAEREAAKFPEFTDVKLRPMNSVAVIGAWTMGSGIAISLLDAGYEVILLEQEPSALERGRVRIADHYGSQVKNEKLAASAAGERQSRLATSIDWQAIARADVVIEAVFEDLAVKRKVFAQIDAVARPGALLATNTSYLDVDAIASATDRASDVIGLHFFSPANLMKLVEVVQGSVSAPDAVATGLALARRLRKLPVVTRNAFGFIGNRIYAAYRRQCEFMLEDGAYPEQVDQALQSFGFAMGPFAVADMSGLDIAWRMRQAQAGTRDPSARYVEIPDRLCEAGRLGRKTLAGYYRYEADAKSGLADTAVRDAIDAASAQKGIARRVLPQDEIQRRALLTMANEAALLLAEGVARRASDVDVVLVNGYGFPRWEGGPVYWAKQRSDAALEKELDWLAELSGPGFRRGDLAVLLR